MRKTILLLVSILLFSFGNGYSQQNAEAPPNAEGVPMIDYGKARF